MMKKIWLAVAAAFFTMSATVTALAADTRISTDRKSVV